MIYIKGDRYINNLSLNFFIYIDVLKYYILLCIFIGFILIEKKMERGFFIVIE